MATRTDRSITEAVKVWGSIAPPWLFHRRTCCTPPSTRRTRSRGWSATPTSGNASWSFATSTSIPINEGVGAWPVAATLITTWTTRITPTKSARKGLPMNRSPIRTHAGLAVLLGFSVCFLALAADSANVGGNWIFANVAGLAVATPTPATNGMVIQQNGNKIRGTLTVPRGGESTFEGTINGNHL